MTGTMNGQWRKVPAFAGARMFAALMFAAATLAISAGSAAAQQSAVRHYCRADFARHCQGLRPDGRDAILCLQANITRLSRNCHKAVMATLQSNPAPRQAAEDAPPPPRAISREASIVSARPPRANLQAHPARYAKPAAVERRAASEQLPPESQADAADRGAPAQGKATERNARSDSLPPEAKPSRQASRRTAAPERAPHDAAAAERAKRAAINSNPLVRACWNDLNRHCRGMRAGGGREFACLTQHSRNLSPGCWQAYRAAARRTHTSER